MPTDLAWMAYNAVSVLENLFFYFCLFSAWQCGYIYTIGGIALYIYQLLHRRVPPVESEFSYLVSLRAVFNFAG